VPDDPEDDDALLDDALLDEGAVVALAELLGRSRRVVFFTGAGVSTESGLPDFRSSEGIWTRYDPRRLTFEQYVASADVRALHWRMRREFFALGARPNAAHLAVAAMETAGRSLGVITQNVDGLHTDAGSLTVVEIHGTARRITCLGVAPHDGVATGCGWSAGIEWAFERLDAGGADPHCPVCGGLVKSATISFGQALDADALARADALLAAADAVVVVGSSLQVYPAAGLPARAAARGVPCAILNREPTPLDDDVDVVVLGSAAVLLPRAVRTALTGV